MKNEKLVSLISIPVNAFIYFFFVHYAFSGNCFSCSATWINIISSLIVATVIAFSSQIAKWIFGNYNHSKGLEKKEESKQPN